MKSDTPNKMKFKRLQRQLHESRRGTIGLLEGLWIEVAKNCPQGDIGKFTNEEIAIMCDWDGDCNELIAALVQCGWLDECRNHRLVVHDWQEHCPRFVKGTLASQKKDFIVPMANVPPSEPPPQPIAQPTPEPPSEPPSETPSETPTTKPSLTKPNHTKPSQANSSVAEATEPPVLVFPTSGDPTVWNLTTDQVENWRILYPSLDVVAECRKALAWVQANNRKTAKGMTRFLVTWLNRANDSARPPAHHNGHVNVGHVSAKRSRIEEVTAQLEREAAEEAARDAARV